MRTCSTPPSSAASAAFSFACMPPVATPAAISSRLSAGGKRAAGRCFDAIQHAFHVRQKNQLPRAERRGARRRHLVRIHVVDVARAVAGHARHHRHITVRRQQMEQIAGLDRVTRPTAPSAGSICSASVRKASMPESPTAGAPARFKLATSS